MKKIPAKQSLLQISIIIFLLILPEIGKTEEKLPGKNFFLKLSGGMSYLSLGDTNKYAEGYTNYLKTSSYDMGMEVNGELEKIHFGFDIEGDVVVDITPHFGISFGTGYLSAEKGEDESKMVVTYSEGSQIWSQETKVSAIPIRLGAYYSIPLSLKTKISFQAGAGYYFARWSNIFRKETTTGYWGVLEGKASRNTIGFQGGMGIEYRISSNMILVIEACGRYVKMSKFKGEGKFSSTQGFDYKVEKGTLYYYEAEIAPYGWIPLLSVLDSEPSHSSYRNIREAVVDFTGFSLRAGLKIGLF